MQLNLPPDFEYRRRQGTHRPRLRNACEDREEGRARAIFDAFLESYIELEGDRAGWVPGNSSGQ
jgi:hypothetical protein